MKRETLDALLAAADAKRPVVLATDLESGQSTILERDDADATDVLSTDRSELRDRFYQPFNPPLRMFVVGAAHIAQPLVRMASELGYAVTVIDPRAAFLREERFGDVERTDEWPDEALDRLGIDVRTAIVLLSHDPKLDDPALERALASEAFYVGALGSRRTHEKRKDRLRERGNADDAIARIRAPIGMDIGARTPAEIAASIVAEVTAALRGRLT